MNNYFSSGKSIVVPIHKRGDKTDCCNYRGISLLSTLYIMLSNILSSRLIPCIGVKLLGIINVDFDVMVNNRSDILYSSDNGEKVGV
jgi:hypothetical protein